MHRIKNILILGVSIITLNACITSDMNFLEISKPQDWTAYQAKIIEKTEAQDLQKWWTRFDDPTLNTLVELTLSQSPDRAIAEARIQEARGLRRTTRSSLFPQIGASGNIGEHDTGTIDGDFYDAAFDASFELDVFGVNRKATNAADARVDTLEATYHDVSLTLIGEIIRTYVEMREGQKQVSIAQKNLDIQKKTRDLVVQQRDVGEAPQLDVERAETLVNTTQASISEFQRLADNARLRMTVLTGELPETLSQQLNVSDENSSVSLNDIQPVLISSSSVLALRPDIRAASLTLMENTSLRESAVASLLPTFSISGLYGITDNALINSTSIWSIALGTAVSLIDFGRIEGQIDAARAREVIAFETYRKTILEAIVEVETALNDYSRINDQYVSLDHAYNNANNAFALSEQLYKEGEISFIDLLDSQRTLNDSESSLVSAEVAKAQAAIRVYKSLGVY